MQPLHGMDVEGQLATQQPGVALREQVGGQPVGLYPCLSAGEDIVVDAVYKQGCF